MNDTTTDPRRKAFDLAAAGIAAGLPVPLYVRVAAHDGPLPAGLTLQCGDDDTDTVDRWAAWLGLPRPALVDRPLDGSGGRWFQPYQSAGWNHPVTGGHTRVVSYCDVPAPADAERPAVTR
ncbi:hypothetical protein [Micromonospora inyonensis]|uniref:Uncharacterized protein n=1 Tax=Micromonospora inyonensis TaxID=47866 RepID=A0A1C6RTB7_9ACTN|nr:hypothetical protein [Micromonospora inyonensis]SCL20445.1 hypothetical protein GA0074694_3039 [Micromonospora inyonensis]SCL25489.1 hypothetical protein GA0074694_4234 [Micromonospora inyonensis]